MYFDPQLVKIIVSCGDRRDNSVEAFGTCVRSVARDQASNGLSKELVASMLKNPADTHSRSIAEERPFVMDAYLSFLSPDKTGSPLEQLWPFEFRYEIAFPASVPFLREGDKGDGHRTPWEFQELRNLIAEKVSQGVQSDATIRAMFGRVRGFTSLQRFFRVALEGNLGDQFPIEKLIALARETRTGHRPTETRRWEVKPVPC